MFQPIEVDKKMQEELNLSFITRDNIYKAYGEGMRAKKIRQYIYDKSENLKKVIFLQGMNNSRALFPAALVIQEHERRESRACCLEET